MKSIWKCLAPAAALALVATATAAGAETLTIGVIAPLTGGGAPWGMAAAVGTRLAAEEANAQGGLDVGGEKVDVKIIAYDDKYMASEAVSAYNRLVKQDGVNYIVLVTSAATMALRQNIEDDEVLALTASYTKKALDETTHHMFRLYSTPSDYVPSLVSWLKDNIKERRVVVVNPNDETGWDQTELSERVFLDNGFDALGHELFERSQVDFQPMLTKIIAMNPEIIEMGGTSPATAGLIVRQARELGYEGLFTKMGGAGPRDIVEAAGKEASEGIINMLYADPANAGYQKLAQAYTASEGHPPNEIIVSFYDGAKVLLAAIEMAGTVDDTAAVAAAFSEVLPMPSVQGDELSLGGKAMYGVDAQVMTVNYIGEIRDGEPVVTGKTH
ncbi:MAG: ABC transporter substrate-binding protein [Rhodospirillum sp.]|nr:ABC transporter substrate-binding protein [Rhodospirillum sp.]MCF8489709.1 ABC transporter substrate-binding protein [Rhodospirillum sp.]MCF8502572.1 ABC transporter substrate-binding protein [Rhodospirillum sp.]